MVGPVDELADRLRARAGGLVPHVGVTATDPTHLALLTDAVGRAGSAS